MHHKRLPAAVADATLAGEAYDAAVAARMADAENKVREYLAQIGRRGGLNSRRELSRQHAKQI